MPFLYKERKQRESNISGVVSTPNYTKIEPNAELREKMQREANKRAR